MWQSSNNYIKVAISWLRSSKFKISEFQNFRVMTSSSSFVNLQQLTLQEKSEKIKQLLGLNLEYSSEYEEKSEKESKTEEPLGIKSSKGYWDLNLYLNSESESESESDSEEGDPLVNVNETKTSTSGSLPSFPQKISLTPSSASSSSSSGGSSPHEYLCKTNPLFDLTNKNLESIVNPKEQESSSRIEFQSKSKSKTKSKLLNHTCCIIN